MTLTMNDTKNMSLDEVLHYCDLGLLDIEGADLIAQAYDYGYEKCERECNDE